MSLKVEPRRGVSWQMQYATPVLAVALTILTGFFLFLFMGYNPFQALMSYFVSPLLSLTGLSELGVKAAPLIMIAVGLAVGFRANVWNIGAEGQLTMGAIAGGGVALATWGQTGPWILPAMMIAGILGGMAYAAIPAFLKARFDVSEILTSLMLTYVATLFLSILIYGPWKDPEGYGFPQSRMFTEAAIVPIILEGTRLHIGFLMALAIAVAGILLEDTIQTSFRNLWVIGANLIIFGLLLGVVDRVAANERPIESLTFKHALWYGGAQMLALVPGVSRSGSTITMGLALRYTREAATRYAFLLAIPAVVASAIFQIPDVNASAEPGMPKTIVATVVAFVVGYAVIAWLLRYLRTHSYLPFVIYRVALGMLVLGLLWAGVLDPHVAS